MNFGGVFKYIFVTIIFTGGLIFYISTMQKADEAKMDKSEIEMDIDFLYADLEFADNKAAKERILKRIAVKEAELAKIEGKVEKAVDEAEAQRNALGEEFKAQSKEFLSTSEDKELAKTEKELGNLK